MIPVLHIWKIHNDTAPKDFKRVFRYQSIGLQAQYKNKNVKSTSISNSCKEIVFAASMYLFPKECTFQAASLNLVVSLGWSAEEKSRGYDCGEGQK